MRYRITTATGSVYRVEERQDGWWLAADNVPNPNSLPLADGEWKIAVPQPWPAVEGRPLLLLSRHYGETEHPDRMPGGGKWTSPVRSIELETESVCESC